MSEDLKVYNLAAGGVQLVKEEVQLANEELRQGQNAVFGVNDQGADLETRPGMSRFNTEAMSGAVIGFANVPLADLRPDVESFFFRPIADNGLTDGWTHTGPNFFSQVDEVTPDDVDFVTGDLIDFTGRNLWMDLTAHAFNETPVGGTLRIRAKWAGGAVGSYNLFLALWTSTFTIIGTSNPLVLGVDITGSYQTLEFDLVNDLGYAGAPFDWSILLIQLQSVKVSGAVTTGPDVSWVELELQR